jgi:hypothetical protein
MTLRRLDLSLTGLSGGRQSLCRGIKAPVILVSFFLHPNVYALQAAYVGAGPGALGPAFQRLYDTSVGGGLHCRTWGTLAIPKIYQTSEDLPAMLVSDKWLAEYPNVTR